MLYYLSINFSDQYHILKYISFRSGGAVLTALIISFIIGPFIIEWLNKKQQGFVTIREDTPEQHLKKAGTPTMGGIMILFSITITSLIWGDLTNLYIWLVLFVMLSFGLIGMIDDCLHLKRKKGLNNKIKFTSEIIVSLIFIVVLTNLSNMEFTTGLAVPFFKDILLDLGWFFIIFTVFVITGTANAVNLTDGLDGLAIVPVMIAISVFAIISYLVGNIIYAKYLQLFYISDAGELTVLCSAIIGAGLGFLWFNAPPARIFMGDTGSLSIGGALGAIAVITKHEIVLSIVGGLFVLEAVSVILQVASFKLTGKRIFRMAPLHHHYEKKGWAEPTIVIRFWIIAVILAILGLATLKLR